MQILGRVAVTLGILGATAAAYTMLVQGPSVAVADAMVFASLPIGVVAWWR